MPTSALHAAGQPPAGMDMDGGMDAARSLPQLRQRLARWHTLLDGRPDDPAMAEADSVLANVQALYDAIYATDFSAFQVGDVAGVASEALDDLFDFQLRLRDRMPEWRRQGVLQPATVTATRNAIRILRYTCDIIGEVAHGYPRLAVGETTHKAFDGPPAWTSVHPSRAFGERVEFRSGDVLLVRGQLANSAAIARIGDVASQFSHTGIIHVGADREPVVVEALIEDGASITPLDRALRHGLGRAILFRHRDNALAADAAKLIHDRVAASLRPGGRRILYDFTMRLDGTDELFCSKLVRLAYLEASRGGFDLPAFHTRIAHANRDFIDRIGVTATETFAPGDLEVEPGFDVVAEWRDYRVTPSLRLQDLIMSKLFQWMDQHGYVFKDTAGIRAIEVLGSIAGALPDFAKRPLTALAPKVPSNMTRDTIGAIAMLHKTCEPILARLLALEDDRIAATGRPLHPREVQAELETIREAGKGRVGYLALPA